MFIVVAVVCAVVASLCCQNVNSVETPTVLNVSELDFDSFRAQFHRRYEVGSEELMSRQNCYQVRDEVREETEKNK